MQKTLKRFVLLLCLTAILAQQASSQALLAPAENYVINRAVAGVIANRIMVSEGVAANDAVWIATKAANDPIYKATMAGISSQMTAVNVAATVAGGALAIAGAPVWLTIAAGLGITALGAYFVSSDSLQKVSILQSGPGVVIQSQSPPKKVSYDPPSVPGGSTVPNAGVVALAAGLAAYRLDCTDSKCLLFPPAPAKYEKLFPFSADVEGYLIGAYSLEQVQAFMSKWFQAKNAAESTEYWKRERTFTRVFLVPRAGSTEQDLYWTFIENITKKHVNIVNVFEQSKPVTTKEEVTYETQTQTFTQKSYSPSWNVLQSAILKIFQDLTTAYQNFTDDQKAIPVPDDLLAKLADESLRRAAQVPGYQGIPYDATDPITPEDVKKWKAANPSAPPTFGDMLRPAQNSATDTGGIPLFLPGMPPSGSSSSNTNTNPGTDPGTNPGTSVSNGQLNLGEDPNVPDPELEETPEASQILEPLLSLFPELRSFQVSGHVGDCPKPSFEVFGKTIVMDSHCAIAEEHRQAIGAVMVAVWVLVGLLILLSA